MQRLQRHCVVVVGLLVLAVSVARGAPEQTSPIDIAPPFVLFDPLLTPPVFNYAAGGVNVKNPGHNHAGVEIGGFAGQTLTYNAEQYNLIQIHFHANSEHMLDTTTYDMEMHMVHQKDGDPTSILVVGRWMDRSTAYTDNLGLHLELDKVFGATKLDPLHPTNPPHLVIPIPVPLGGNGMPDGQAAWDMIPATPEAGNEVMIAAFDPSKLLAQSQHIYRYSGSLTAFGDKETPVEWIIYDEVMLIDENQYDRFRSLLDDLGLPNGNAMPIELIANAATFEVTTNVPEPSGMALLALIGLVAVRRGRR